MNPTPSTELTQSIRDFVQWARAMGWRYQMAPTHLTHFARFAKEHGVVTIEGVDSALLLQYRKTLCATLAPLTVNGYLSSLRALWRYLQREQLVGHDPTKVVAPQRLHSFIPHLYSEQELAAIERAAQAGIRNARSEAHRFAALTRHAALCLLRDCALRISEVCNLRLDHYAGPARTVRIERTKFFKTRLIPLPRSLCLLLDGYLEHRRQWLSPRGESPMLFVSTIGLPLGRVALEHWYKQLLVDAGLFRPRQRKGATVFGSTNAHALRHSFAVRTLERWQQDNRNVEHLLPLLSAYMGHVKVTYTAHYLHLTPLLMQLASERFGKLASGHLDDGIQGADDDT